MEDQLVYFELAKLAKEKGFTKENGYACRYGWVCYYTAFTGQIYTEDPKEMSMDSLGNAHLIERPTQSRLQKWLRDVYKLHIEINRDEDMWKYSLYEYSHGNKHIPRGFPQFISYEEALEAGLLEALKLI